MSVEAACALEAEVAEVCRRRTSTPRWRQLGVEQARLAVEAVDGTRSHLHDGTAVEIEDIAIPVDQGRIPLPSGAQRLPVRIYRPAGAQELLPGLVYLHGAGWTFDGSRSHDQLARSLAASANSAVLLPAFAKAPEAPHPVALEQCYQLLVQAGAGQLRRGIDPARLAVAGDGTGGSLAAGLALLASQRGGPPLSAHVLVCPAVDPACDTPSHHARAGVAALDPDDIRWLWEQYVRDPHGSVDITAAPLRAAVDQLQGLPPALVITAEVDVLRDEGERFAGKLRQAGVEVLAIRYLGTVHGFCHLAALRRTAAARALIDQVSCFLRRANDQVAQR